MEGDILVADAQGFDKGRLRNFHFAELTHPEFAFFLFVKQFAFAGDVAAVAFGGDVFAQGGNGFAGDDAAADCRLDLNFEQMPGNQVF